MAAALEAVLDCGGRHTALFDQRMAEGLLEGFVETSVGTQSRSAQQGSASPIVGQQAAASLRQGLLSQGFGFRTFANASAIPGRSTEVQ